MGHNNIHEADVQYKVFSINSHYPRSLHQHLMLLISLQCCYVHNVMKYVRESYDIPKEMIFYIHTYIKIMNLKRDKNHALACQQWLIYLASG